MHGSERVRWADSSRRSEGGRRISPPATRSTRLPAVDDLDDQDLDDLDDEDFDDEDFEELDEDGDEDDGWDRLDGEEGRAPICPYCGVTTLPAHRSNVIDSHFVCDNESCDAYGDAI